MVAHTDSRSDDSNEYKLLRDYPVASKSCSKGADGKMESSEAPA